MDHSEGSAFKILVKFSEFPADPLLQSFKMGRKHQGKAIACSLVIHKINQRVSFCLCNYIRQQSSLGYMAL